MARPSRRARTSGIPDVRRRYVPGSAGYYADRAKDLRRQRDEAKQALAGVKRAKASKETIRKVKDRSARIERELAAVTALQKRIAPLSPAERKAFTALGVATQKEFLTKADEFPRARDRIMTWLSRYPDRSPPPGELPDPFASLGEDRNAAWTIVYRAQHQRKRRLKRERERKRERRTT